MTEAYETAAPVHPPQATITWPAVFAGAAVAVALGAMLNLLGVALGAGSFNPFDLQRDSGAAVNFTIAAGVWVTLANALALFVGAMVASRSARYADNHGGMLHGLLVWATAFFAAILIAGLASGPAANTAALGVAQDAASARPDAAAQPQGVLQSDGTYAPADASVAPDPVPTAAPAIPPATPKAASVTATMALWAFLAMLIGAVAAVFGGRYGARRHAWEARLAGETAMAHERPPLHL